MARFSKIFPNIKFTRETESQSFLSLFVSNGLLHGAAIALISIFLPIFLFQMSGGTFLLVGSYYAAVSLLYVFFLAPSMRLINRIGFSHTLILGGLFSVIMTTFLFLVNAENFNTFLLPIMFSMLMLWIFHWVPYHVDFTLFGSNRNRGKQVSFSLALAAFLGVVGPILAGFIIKFAGYQALFGVVFCLLITATVSYVYVPETKTKFTWSVRKTWRQLFNREHRNLLVGEYASGAEIIVNLVVWPIFLFEILRGNVLEIGAISTVVVAITIAVQLYVGGYLDKHSSSLINVLRVGSGLYAIGWIVKIFVLSTLQVFLVGLYHNIVRVFTRTPFNTLVYDMSADQGKYLDEYTVLREMANHLGRASSLIVISFLSIFIPIAWTFVIAAVASIALNFIYYTHNR